MYPLQANALDQASWKYPPCGPSCLESENQGGGEVFNLYNMQDHMRETSGKRPGWEEFRSVQGVEYDSV